MAKSGLAVPIAAMASLLLAGCVVDDRQIAVYQPPAGSNEVLSGPIEAAPGHSLVTGDLVMAAGGAIPKHYHVGEEFLYILGGSATLYREGEAALTLTPGQAIRIAHGTVHWGKAGPDGVRAVSSWVVPDGQPLRIAVPE